MLSIFKCFEVELAAFPVFQESINLVARYQRVDADQKTADFISDVACQWLNGMAVLRWEGQRMVILKHAD